jgi:hypothetical protein
MVVGSVEPGPGQVDRVVVAHQVIDLSDKAQREPLWALEVSSGRVSQCATTST